MYCKCDFTKWYITISLDFFFLDPSNSEDISLDELEEELEEHKDYDVSHGPLMFLILHFIGLLICMLFDIASMYVR